MPIEIDELPEEVRAQFQMFDMMVDQMTDEALQGFICFLTEKLETRRAG